MTKPRTTNERVNTRSYVLEGTASWPASGWDKEQRGGGGELKCSSGIESPSAIWNALLILSGPQASCIFLRPARHQGARIWTKVSLSPTCFPLPHIRPPFWLPCRVYFQCLHALPVTMWWELWVQQLPPPPILLYKAFIFFSAKKRNHLFHMVSHILTHFQLATVHTKLNKQCREKKHLPDSIETNLQAARMQHASQPRGNCLGQKEKRPNLALYLQATFCQLPPWEQGSAPQAFGQDCNG